MERIRAVIASDREKKGIRGMIKEHIEESNRIEVICLSRVKKSRIRSEIKPKNPDLILLPVSLDYPKEVEELSGFVRTLRKHLPKTKIVIQAPGIEDSQKERILAAGADAWLDEKLAYEYLGQSLEDVVAETSS